MVTVSRPGALGERVSCEGEKEQVTPTGRLVQPRVTAPEKP